MIAPQYRTQVDLLFRILPHVAKEEVFALKGGTAINLFVRDMPRLSVDIDLTYLPFDDRKTALKNISISDALGRIKDRVENSISGISVTSTPQIEGQDVKLNCQLRRAQVKIEVNTTTRGHIYPVRLMQAKESVQESFGKFAAINVVSHAELFGSKICAALDRQHPRVSVKKGTPNWKLFPLEVLKDLPAIQWKLSNIQKLIRQNPDKHAEQLRVLQKKLDASY